MCYPIQTHSNISPFYVQSFPDSLLECRQYGAISLSLALSLFLSSTYIVLLLFAKWYTGVLISIFFSVCKMYQVQLNVPPYSVGPCAFYTSHRVAMTIDRGRDDEVDNCNKVQPFTYQMFFYSELLPCMNMRRIP